MKYKTKLSIMIISIMVIAVGGVSMIQLSQASGITMNLSRQKTMYLARQYALVFENKIDGYIKALQSVSNVMNSYENLPPESRRREYENIMQSVFEDNPDFVQMFTVWESNTIGGADARFIGRPGSADTGQFVFTPTRENGKTEKQTGDIVQAAMEHLKGPNNITVEIVDPIVINQDGRDTWCLRIMVPILNKRLNKAVGVIGCLLNVDLIQPLLERAIKNHDEISGMAIYTGTGFILASYMPERIGRQLVDAETQYGEYLDWVVRAVENAQECELSSCYDPIFKSNMNVSISPISLANSPTTWSVMIGSTESYILKDVNAMKRFVIVLLVLALTVASVLVYFVINGADRQNANVKKPGN
jgi:methyl-accepting chemotaxis protein